jgi:hypothetical protein
MFIDKRNLYSILFLLGILLLVLFFSRFSYGVEGLTTSTPVINATPSTVIPASQVVKPEEQVVKPAAQVVKPATKVVTSNIVPATKVVTSNIVPATKVVTSNIVPATTTTPVIQATSSPTVTTDPTPTSSNTLNNLASITETPTISTATIVKVSDIQAQVTNLRNIIQKDVVIHATDAVKLLQNNQDIKKALSLIIDKPVRKEIDILIENMNKVYMNLYLQTMQIQDNLTNFKNQYQNL